MSNRLAKETSPYLRQHSENPVDWYPWGEEAFRRARDEDKPIHLSLGYAACHWCHVMAHESFENPETARLMNERFINIKVDRQERPDLDDIYQQVVQMMGQGGGWPLTVFLTAEREPFFGGTYFPPDDGYGRPGFTQLLLGLSDAWQNNRAALQQNVKQFLQGYRKLDASMLEGDTPLEPDQPAAAARLFARNTDPVNGGLGNAPKFPNPACHDLVLRVYQRLHEPDLLRSVELTLDRMAAGGLYDHLGGGFARYCVDERWAVPHFEKMLYDNGQLVKLYADAYRETGKPAWRRVFEETIDYILRDMTHPEGGFYASEDADSEGEEGKFYVWTLAQVQAALGEPDAALACRAYGVTANGNFEHGSTVLHRAVALDAVQELQLKGLRDRLLLARAQRIRPGRDENILTSWNALMVQGLCAAYQATGTTTYLDAAKRAADFILERLSTPEGGLYRAWREGLAKVPGLLEDYAFLVNALIDLYECDFEKRYVERATQLAEVILDKFWEDGLYFTPSDGEPLVHRPRAPHDSAWPSGTSASVLAFLRLFELTGRELYHERAEQVLAMYRAAAAQNPFGFAHLLAAQDWMQRGPISIVIAGERSAASALVAKLQRRYLPARVLAFAEDVPIGGGRHALAGQTSAYVCRNRTCEPPVTSAEELVERCLK
ncbi:thioredoxin domain-containing protein [Pseudomonas sp. FW306-02-F02-AA]|uniref:Thioredoxin n=1 Tax=Pseudomonas fluorescens TaxID=294 RepID=A0A0N9WQ64_PSEFL|nr:MULTISPECIES: thioredoxin domain-containing protein [Pseudomonas]ALI04154.1 thioredoxin [Pseudomonas fluorescens]PMZ03257.1 thioredoxin domain-containing protein [Pseudomonas sp. FW306-02-F02-AB]PMZ07769.1 thioredoxin domain-containing protein [Pseudomonas sp. FW306-02-H06C]PMZ13483.1 thioredoxin domain-containing protein [Pseudomonas sp. FW306-02-F02-AA]PMZ19724.1 thioredoxin domain-containing protein [Pseudomonas sp. FW306-02-F08-AA]